MFRNPTHAGEILGHKLIQYKDNSDVVVIGIVSGGIEPAYGISKILNCPVSPIIISRIYNPDDGDWTLGTINGFEECSFNEEVISQQNLTKKQLDGFLIKAKEKVIRLQNYFNINLGTVNFKDKILILTDEAMVSGYSVLAAIKTLRKYEPKRIILAVPLASIAGSLAYVKRFVDESVCLEVPFICQDKNVYYRTCDLVTYHQAKYLISLANNKIKNDRKNRFN